MSNFSYFSPKIGRKLSGFRDSSSPSAYFLDISIRLDTLLQTTIAEWRMDQDSVPWPDRFPPSLPADVDCCHPTWTLLIIRWIWLVLVDTGDIRGLFKFLLNMRLLTCRRRISHLELEYPEHCLSSGCYLSEAVGYVTPLTTIFCKIYLSRVLQTVIIVYKSSQPSYLHDRLPISGSHHRTCRN